MEVIVYLIVLPTGQLDEDGLESVIVLDVKLTRSSAQRVADNWPGSRIDKLKADKTT